MKKVTISVLLGIFVLTAINAHAAWYTCSITKITPYYNGSIKVQVLPGTNETGFTGYAWVQIRPNDPGAKNMYAALLTALSLNMEVKLVLDNPPDLNNQALNGVMLAQ